MSTCNTNLDSKIERGDEEEATEAYILVRRGDDDEGNKVICKGLIARVVSSNMKANWYYVSVKRPVN